jgi:hypothetical protein
VLLLLLLLLWCVAVLQRLHNCCAQHHLLSIGHCSVNNMPDSVPAGNKQQPMVN